ncbi:MAG TPA: TolC family outer membrane protein [Paraburkholderia sp.]|jgi:outer membrane protein|uniref:TolC family outer membrane protein n=1 Tax=Paraburkholderia sp. TaxID=1926495 RepID=UPI002DED6ACC|nr:TolC family outer membrane protein [Paraburkholderia sp.]
MNRTAATITLVLSLLAGGAHGADLLSVVSDALDHDPALAASRDSARAAAQAVPKARAALLPHVSGGWGRAYNGIVTEDFPTQHYWQSGWTVGLTQPVFDWASWTAYRQADWMVLQGRLQTASAEQNAILAAAQAYFDVLAAAEEVARATDYLHALDAHLALLARAKAAGEATLVDVRDGESSRAQAQLQLLDAQSQARFAQAALERITGHSVDAISTLAPGGVPRLDPPDAQRWITQAQSRGYAVQIGEVALRIARFETEKAQAAGYPNVSLQITHTPAGAAGGYSRPTTTTTGMLAVTIPLYSGGETTAKVDEASALEDKARDELDAAVRDAGANARDGWLRVSAGGTRMAALDQVVQRAQASLEATRIGFGAGSRTSLDVLRATDALYAGRRDLIRARYDVVLAVLKLLGQTAMLDLDEVGRLNTQLFAVRPAGASAER